MATILKVMVIIILAPLALCVGVYGCTAAHVAAVSSAIPAHPAKGAVK